MKFFLASALVTLPLCACGDGASNDEITALRQRVNDLQMQNDALSWASHSDLDVEPVLWPIDMPYLSAATPASYVGGPVLKFNLAPDGKLVCEELWGDIDVFPDLYARLQKLHADTDTTDTSFAVLFDRETSAALLCYVVFTFETIPHERVSLLLTMSKSQLEELRPDIGDSGLMEISSLYPAFVSLVDAPGAPVQIDSPPLEWEPVPYQSWPSPTRPTPPAGKTSPDLN